MKSKKSKPRPPTPQKKRRGVYIRGPQDVRRLLSRLINETLQGELEVAVLKAVTYASNILLKSLEVGELVERLQALEEKNEHLLERRTTL